LQSQDSDASVRAGIVRLIKDCGAYDRVMEKARGYARQAGECLDGFPAGDFRRALESIPGYITDRDR